MNYFEVYNYYLYFAHQINRKTPGVVELVETLDLGSSAVRCESSSLSACNFSTTSK